MARSQMQQIAAIGDGVESVIVFVVGEAGQLGCLGMAFDQRVKVEDSSQFDPARRIGAHVMR